MEIAGEKGREKTGGSVFTLFPKCCSVCMGSSLTETRERVPRISRLSNSYNSDEAENDFSIQPK